MQKGAVGIDARFIRAVLFVVFFDEEPSALRTILIDRFEMRNKIALRVIRTAVEFFASSLRFPCDDLSVAAGHRALRKRDRARVAAFGKS